METTGPKTNFPNPFTFSQSSLQDYFDCPRRFRLRYLDRLNWPAVESEPVVEIERRQQEGQVFHRLVQQHLLGIPAEKLSRLANTPNLERWWQNYVGTDLGINDYAKYVEPSLSAPLLQQRVLAKYDLIAIQTGRKALIVDWKTYARRPRDEWLAAHWQTRVYRSLLVMAGAHLNHGQALRPEQVEMVYWFADFPSEPARFRYQADQFQRDRSALESLIAEIASAAQVPLTEDEKKCRFCVYRSFCERGRQAGEGLESETGGETESAFDINFEQIGEIEY